MEQRVRISIIIATYNRGTQLIKTLDSLVSQTLDKVLWEAVIVNNNSNDDTDNLFKRYLSEHPDFTNIYMIFEGSQGLSYARNSGIEHCKGEYILIIDDDELVNPEFAQQYLNFFETYHEASAAGGKIEPLYEFETPSWLSHYVERPISATIDLGTKIKLFKGESYPIGGNMAFRREVLEQVGLFNTSLGRTGTKLLGGEEKDLFRRIKDKGGKIYWVPGPSVLHIIPKTRLTRQYFSRLTKMIGKSERLRTSGHSKAAYLQRLFSESIKWGGTVILSLGYLLKLQPSKAGYLILMRWNITRGLLNMLPDEPK